MDPELDPDELPELDALPEELPLELDVVPELELVLAPELDEVDEQLPPLPPGPVYPSSGVTAVPFC